MSTRQELMASINKKRGKARRLITRLKEVDPKSPINAEEEDCMAGTLRDLQRLDLLVIRFELNDLIEHLEDLLEAAKNRISQISTM